jgi:hypothetical protein
MAAELESLWRKYQRRAEINWVEFYSEKLRSALAALDTLKRERELGGGKEKKSDKKEGAGADAIAEAAGAVLQEKWLDEEVRRLRLQRAAEEFEDLSIVSRMIQVWENIKDIRRQQGFQATKVDLKFRRRTTNREQDLATQQEELEAELAELKERHGSDLADETARFLKKKATLEGKLALLSATIVDLEEQEAAANLGDAADDEDDGESSGEDDVRAPPPPWRSRQLKCKVAHRDSTCQMAPSRH